MGEYVMRDVLFRAITSALVIGFALFVALEAYTYRLLARMAP